MKERLQELAKRAQTVADAAAGAANSVGDEDRMSELNHAMVAYRQVAVDFLSIPSLGEYVRADALRYEGETREVVERIADLIDRLNNSAPLEVIDQAKA